MRIIDTFMFHNEYDILELRLSEHYDHVDKIVIVECDRTYTGRYKGFNLEKNLDRYTRWMDKIEYIKIENCPSVENLSHETAWDNEWWQRDNMSKGWNDVTDEDVILMSDLDEIVRPEALQFIRNTNYGFYRLNMPGFYFKLNYMDTYQHYSAWGKAYRGFKTQPRFMRNCDDVPGKSKITLHHAGWHFGWVGDVDFIKNKLKSFSHVEFDTELNQENIDNLDKIIEQGGDHIRPNNQKTWRKVAINEYYPKTILNNIEKYRKYILPDGQKSVTDYWTGGILEIDEFNSNL